MKNNKRYKITLAEKKKYISYMSEELQILRIKAGLSQDELSSVIGVSRQTYGTMERKLSAISWNTYLSLILFFDYNKDTHDYIRGNKVFPHEIFRRINEDDTTVDAEISGFLGCMNSNILDSLDEQALATIKAIVMVEYARCNPTAGDSVKFYEGLARLTEQGGEKKDAKVKNALKNLRSSK